MRHLPDFQFPFLLTLGRQLLVRLGRFGRCVGILLFAAIALSGCVDADVGVRFEDPNRGEIIQHIQLGERLQSLSGSSLQQWLRAIEQQAASVGGTVQKATNQELTIKIPFTSGNELAEKFNQFFGVFNQELLTEANRLPRIESQLTLSHSNFLLLERDRLVYTVDLRSLGVLSASGDVLVSPTSLINLQFQLETPWGARSIIKTDTLRPRSLKGGKTLIWTLIPGQQNTLETIFWMPNPLGIGAALIIVLVLLGIFLKYPQVANKRPSPSPFL